MWFWLSPSKTLRKQLFSSFGLAAIVSSIIVVASSCVCVWRAGEIVKHRSSQLMKQNYETKAIIQSSKLMAEKLSARMSDIEGSIQILVECLRDRIVGYPSMEGWENGDFVPFLDTITQSPKYPLKMPPVPLDWNITLQSTYEAERGNVSTKISTKSAAFHFQGSCDPNGKASACFSDSNNITTGGNISPTETHWGIYQSTGDLSVFMKPLYETRVDTLKLNVYFANEGAGATLQFPASRIIPSQETYTSMGCDWMLNINNRTSMPYGTTDFCHTEGEAVSSRNYNPMEEAWAPFFIKLNGNIGWYGPLSEDAYIMKAGKAVFDRLTGTLIGIVTADILLDSFAEELNTAFLSQESEIFLVKSEGERILSSQVAKDHDHLQRQPFEPKFFDTLLSGGNISSSLQRFEQAFVHEDHLIAAYPFPLPQDDFQGEYKLQYFVIHSIPNKKNPTELEIERAIDQDVITNIITSTLLGLVGCVLVLAILWLVSSVLTQPLVWIQDVAHRILQDPNENDEKINFAVGDNRKEVKRKFKYAPNTEINELVKVFQNVLSGLSGEGVSTIADPANAFIKNSLSYHKEFGDYVIVEASSEHGEKKYSSKSNDVSEEKLEQSENLTPLFNTNGTTTKSFHKIERSTRLNSGPVVDSRTMTSKPVSETQGLTEARKSSLFKWIVLLIILPFLLTNAILVVIVFQSITEKIPQWVKDAEAGSEIIAKQNLLLIASSKASVMSSIVGQSIRDLHFMTRIAGWLLFGGVQRSDGFTTSLSASEECKADPATVCPFNQPQMFPCACDWRDPWEDVLDLRKCWAYNISDSRYLQAHFFAVQSTDTDKTTGDRNTSSSFPTFGNTSNTTAWWSDVNLVPGSEKFDNATGFDTTYDRLRVSSAAASFYFPIYNYATSLSRQKPILGLYLSFENDGLFHGFDGCFRFDQEVANYRATESNRASEINPFLCPLGKYGYDPRCRGWYDKGKQKYKDSNVPVHVTSPYSFASAGVIATSATSPIANPETGEYAGQVLLDYFSIGLLRSMETLSQTLSFVITPTEDITGGDTVVAPNKTQGWRSVSIGEVLFPTNQNSSNGDLRQTFEKEVLSKMKAGESGILEVQLNGESGSMDSYYLSFAPVRYRSMLPLDPSSFLAGVNATKDLIYSVAIGESIANIQAPFQIVEDQMNDDLLLLLSIYISVLVIVSCLYVGFIVIAAMLVTRPMITLLEIVQEIQSKKFCEDIPPLLGGCREVEQVYSIFSRLNKIVMVSNTAFFSHNLDRANYFLKTALALFEKISDEKAIGIASNNLGNTLFAILFEAKKKNEMHICNSSCMIAQALRQYDEAVKNSQKSFDLSQPGSKPRYAERLSDRLFNRGLFLIFASDYACAPTDAKMTGYEDISRARILHYELKAYLLEKKLLFEEAALYWNRLFRRINCLLAFYHDPVLRQIWDAETILDEADQLVMAAWEIPNAPLFNEVTPIGRRQQLEGSAILLCLQTSQENQAVRLAMRMFAQDEYLLESAFIPAAECLLLIGKSDKSSVSERLQEELRQIVKNKFRSAVDFLTMEKF